LRHHQTAQYLEAAMQEASGLIKASAEAPRSPDGGLRQNRSWNQEELIGAGPCLTIAVVMIACGAANRDTETLLTGASLGAVGSTWLLPFAWRSYRKPQQLDQ
jgi:hypothetical protein